jgi:hypothetical protein
MSTLSSGQHEISPGGGQQFSYDVGAHNKLRHLFGIDTPLDYEAVQRLVARWRPYAGVVYFHLLVDSLPRSRWRTHGGDPLLM